MQEGTAVLHGAYSTELPADAAAGLKRSGFCGMRSQVQRHRMRIAGTAHLRSACGRHPRSVARSAALCCTRHSCVQASDQLIDLSDFDALAFRVRGDGRTYLANIRTQNWLVGGQGHDVWQAFLFARCATPSGAQGGACVMMRGKIVFVWLNERAKSKSPHTERAGATSGRRWRSRWRASC